MSGRNDEDQVTQPGAEEARDIQFGYTLDRTDRIRAVDDAWCRFAAENDAADLPQSVIGRPLWHFVSGEETRSFYRQLMQKVRDTGAPLTLPFRCDSPTERRFMEITMAPGDVEGELHCRTVLMRVEPRETVDLLRRQPRHGDKLDVCAVCRRVKVQPTRWLEIEEAMRELRLAHPSAPRMRARICPDCEGLEQGISHLVTLPEDYRTDRRYPLVVFLHGAGHARWLFRLYAPPRISTHQSDYILLSPVRDVQDDMQPIETAIVETLRNYPVDRHRVYLTGISAGATLAWALAAKHPQRFAAFVPIAGRGFPERVHRLTDLPVWAFHGAEDPVVPVESARQLIEGLEEAGSANVRLTTYPATGHDAWSRTYSDPLVWRWLLSQRRYSSRSWNAARLG